MSGELSAFHLPVDATAKTGDLRILQNDWNDLLGHLLGDGGEHAALLLCGLRETDHQVTFLVRKVVLLTAEDYLDRGDLHLQIAPTTLAREAKRARMLDAAVILVHSHPFPGRVSADLRPCRHHLGVDRVLAVPLTTTLEYLSTVVHQMHPLRRHFLQTPGRRLEPDATALGVADGGVPPNQVAMADTR